MSYRFKVEIIGIVLGILAAVPLMGQAQKRRLSSSGYLAPRSLDGQPDLQGIWTNSTLTPLERPVELSGKEYFTEQEAAEYEKHALDPVESNRKDSRNPLGRSYDDFWHDETRLVPTHRTSLIVDTPNGRVPPLTPEGQRRADAHAEERKLHGADGPENRSALERCIVASNAGPPMMPGNYNANYQIVQVPGYVLILSEQIHDARVIPLDGRPHLPAHVRQWMGDSRGHWEGNTLVVETTNFRADTNFAGATGQPSIPNTSEGLRLVEHFTRTGPNMIVYEFTVDDPATFSRPWTTQLPLKRTKGPIFEYACHEGNYGLANILSGARAQEKAAAEAAKKNSK